MLDRWKYIILRQYNLHHSFPLMVSLKHCGEECQCVSVVTTSSSTAWTQYRCSNPGINQQEHFRDVAHLKNVDEMLWFCSAFYSMCFLNLLLRRAVISVNCWLSLYFKAGWLIDGLSLKLQVCYRKKWQNALPPSQSFWVFALVSSS